MRTATTRRIGFQHFTTSRTAIVAALMLAPVALPDVAMAETCLLDRNNNGIADASADNDGGAFDDGGDDRSLSCGVQAATSGSENIAIGWRAVAGNEALPSDQATAIGFTATADGTQSLAVGHSATAFGTASVALVLQLHMS